MDENRTPGLILRPNLATGIVGYGAYIPRYRLPASEIARIWKAGDDEGLPVIGKSVSGMDEDTVTMSIEAARNALKRAMIDPKDIRAVWVGSESHPYAVKPSATIVAEAIGCSAHIQAGDWEFACKAGSEAFIAAIGLVGSGMAEYALAIGADTAQGRPGDALEYTAAAAGAAFILGKAEESLAIFNGSFSYVTDTPDFWRRPQQIYPEHGQRFTGEPAYFDHITHAAQHLMQDRGTSPADYKYAVFHQPNTKFPQRVAAQLGFSKDQIKTGLLTPVVGNSYAAASLLGLTAILDEAQPSDRILLVSFGSGAGSDAIDLTVTEKILEVRNKAPRTSDYISRRTLIDYATYVRYRGKLTIE